MEPRYPNHVRGSEESKKLVENLDNLLQGKPIRQNVTVEAAVQEWLEFRATNGLGNRKAKLMGNKLIKWCADNETVLLTSVTPDQAIKFRMTLPFRTTDSSSLSVHWSVICGFFSWAVGMSYIDKTPILSGRQNPQFAIRFKKREVVPPTKEQVATVLATSKGKVKILATLMRETGMALVDAQKVECHYKTAQKFGLSKPERRPMQRQSWLAQGLDENGDPKEQSIQ